MRLARVRPVGRSIRLLAALVVAIATLGLAPAGGQRPALAATPDLTLIAATTYEVHPDEGRVAVTATVTATNHLADTVTRRYFFEEGFLSVLPGTANFAVTAPGESPTVAVSSRSEAGTVLVIGFGSRLAAGRSIVLTLTYDLLDPGGAPDRPVRISPSIVTFEAWASASDATPGSSVEVRVPDGYTTSIERGPLTGPVTTAGWQVYSSGPLAAPLTFVADITADLPGELVDGRRSVTMDGRTAFIVFRAWPDDPGWRDRVSDLVLGGVPHMAADIGVAWPFERPLTITETLVRGTGGFEGAFDPAAGLIEIGYAASPGVILHEAAHAWFNGELVAERWIAEAFASYYAERAALAMGVEIVSPDFDGVPGEGGFPLNAWLPAGEATPEQDAFGAAASLVLAREIAGVVGDDVLREVWTAAAAGAPAYQPIGAPGATSELGVTAPDWRGLLDLLEAHADPEGAAALEGLWRRWVIRPADADALDVRADARETYEAAVADAAPWTLPRPVRDAMRAWQFPAALELAGEAGAVIRQRAAIDAEAAAADLEPPPTLQLAFESGASLAEAAAEAATELVTIDAIRTTAGTRIAEPSVLDVLGLIGVDPEADLRAARDAFEAGDLDAALVSAARARDAWEAAPSIGRGRIISGALLGVAVVLLGWLVWGRRRRGSGPKIEHARPAGRAGGRAAMTERRRRWPAVLAVLLAVGLTLAPPAASPASAATGRLILTTAATYTVDPAAATVRVSVAATYLNDKPSDSDFFYYWRDLTFAVHPEATNIRVSDGSGALSVKPVAEDGFIEAQFRLRRNLLYRQSVKLTIAWDLPGGAPRTLSSIRVGESFATFDLWAWGDPGTSSVTATLPGGYEVETFGSTVERTSLATGVTIRAAAIDNTDEFWTSVTAIREEAFATDELNLPGGIELLVRAWPEDTEWRTQVRAVLREGIPELGELIGLPWPIERVVEVTEVYTPLLEGYAGIFYTLEDRIDISEDLDALVIVHEASHAWFNDSLFWDRWIDEGLADTYAAAVLVEIGEGRQSPTVPRSGDEGRIDLQAWGDPGRITDATEAIELYGYNTSWYVVSEIFKEVGPEKMRAIFEAAANDEIAYPGAVHDEPIKASDGWHRFLDLLEELGGSKKADDLFREYVVTNTGAREMDDRAIAREAYADLVAAGDSWLPPIYVREVMSSWAFAKAHPRIDEAEAILDLRDDVMAAAEALDVDPGPAFEAAYEEATADFDDAEAAGRAELDALAALAEAHEAVSAPLDFVASLGLIDVKPMDAYEEAATAYEEGDLEESAEAATEAVALVGEGPRIGRERLALGVGIGGVALLLLVLVLRSRRRRRRHAAALATAAAAPLAASLPDAASDVTEMAPQEASAGGPYGTLAADSPAPAPSTDGDAGPEGGAADGEGPGAAT